MSCAILSSLGFFTSSLFQKLNGQVYPAIAQKIVGVGCDGRLVFHISAYIPDLPYAQSVQTVEGASTYKHLLCICITLLAQALSSTLLHRITEVIRKLMQLLPQRTLHSSEIKEPAL